jgi:hypothetical protein
MEVGLGVSAETKELCIVGILELIDRRRVNLSHHCETFFEARASRRRRPNGSAARALAWVDALLTGMHDPRESHYALLQAFAPRTLLERARAHAKAWGYLGHEVR